MYKNGLLLTFVLLLAAHLSACSESIKNVSCSRNSDCSSGHLCDPEGRCTEADPLAITPRGLDDVLLGQTDYSQSIQATGGISPYSWTMSVTVGSASLAWLEIDSDTGELRNRQGQAPTEIAPNLIIEVTVLDRSNAGSGESNAHPFTLNIVECIGDQTCFTPEADLCQEGSRACIDNSLSSQCTILNPSSDTDHCGPECLPCPQTANRCLAGHCRCGTGDPCTGDMSCCEEGCFDLQTAQNHCGACDIDCQDMQNVIDPACADGLCTYNQCEPGFYSCDNDATNGCETPADINNCSSCLDRCDDLNVYAHTQDQSCEPAGCDYICMNGFDSCDDDRSNGCETPINTPQNCGQCDRVCPGSNAGNLCLDMPGGHGCGCTQNSDCPTDRMCCDNLCVPHTPTHCGTCDTVCSIQNGGGACNQIQDSSPPAWQCECRAHEDCKGIYEFSNALCDSTIGQCICPGSENCEGIVGDMCCIKDSVLSCVDMTNDPENCGTCGKVCAPAESCSDGACTCTQDTGSCPGTSGAPNCLNGDCVCFLNNGIPCPAGQTCCPNKGCCLSCLDDVADCSIGCANANAIWCNWGCCPECTSEAECPLYHP